jgi:hypothetical protein
MSRAPVSGSPQQTKRESVRTPVGGRQVLSVAGKEPGYHYRIVNDDGDRIQQFLDAGYEFVEANTHRVGDKRVNQATPEGTRAQVSVGAGQKAFVMRIRDEWYKEDQAKKQLHVDHLEQTIKKGSGKADYGTVEITRP